MNIDPEAAARDVPGAHASAPTAACCPTARSRAWRSSSPAPAPSRSPRSTSSRDSSADRQRPASYDHVALRHRPDRPHAAAADARRRVERASARPTPTGTSLPGPARRPAGPAALCTTSTAVAALADAGATTLVLVTRAETRRPARGRADASRELAALGDRQPAARRSTACFSDPARRPRRRARTPPRQRDALAAMPAGLTATAPHGVALAPGEPARDRRRCRALMRPSRGQRRR